MKNSINRSTRSWILSILLSIFLIGVISCSGAQIQPGLIPFPTNTPQAQLPNPASVFCEQQGNRLEIRPATDGSQYGVCILNDGTECDEWAYYRGECGFLKENVTPSASGDLPTALPINTSDYQGWWTYSSPDYGFTIQLPEDWAVSQATTSDPLMNNHLLMLNPRTPAPVDLTIRMTFRLIGEDTLLWPTGVGQGEFIPQGTLEVAGVPARRILLVCPTGQVSSIWYHGPNESDPNIQVSNLEFGFILSYIGIYCEEGYNISGKDQLLGEMVIASLRVP